MKKKGIKKILSMLFALVMIASCMGSVVWEAKAATGSIEITNVQSDSHTYSAYQIFSGNADTTTNTIGNIEWGSGVNLSANYGGYSTIYDALAAISVDIRGTSTNVFTSSGDPLKTAAEVAEVLETYIDNSDVLDAFEKLMENYLSSTYTDANSATQSGSTYTYTIDNLDTGYYLVLDTTGTLAQGDARTHYIVEVVGAVQVAVKEVAPSVSKVINNGSAGGVTVTSASKNETVTFKLTGILPDDLSTYSSYTYIFYDELSENLSYVTGSINVSYTDGTITYQLTESTNYTVDITDDNGKTELTVTILNAKNYENCSIIVTYDATLDENAVAGIVETNTVYLEYSSNPQDLTETNTTTLKTVYVNTFNLDVTKTDGNSSALEGATFTLYKLTSVTQTEFELDEESYYTYTSGNQEMTQCQDGDTWVNGTDYYVLVETKDADSGAEYNVAEFEDLGEGTYVIEESTTPAGYNTAELVQFTITAIYDTTDGSVSSLTTGNANVTADETTSTLSTTVVNNAGTTMPETGGIGRTIFYILGGILILGAAILLITKRLVRRED